jgi:hypothetical protein
MMHFTAPPPQLGGGWMAAPFISFPKVLEAAHHYGFTFLVRQILTSIRKTLTSAQTRRLK